MPSSNSPSAKILIIEDDDGWVQIIREILPSNFHLDHARTIAAAETYLQGNLYDVIVTDLLVSQKDYVLDILQDFQHLIFILKQLDHKYELWPPIIVTTIWDVAPRIPELLSDYGSWVWGWHVKDRFNQSKFYSNIENAVNTRREFEELLISKSDKPPDQWTIKDMLSHITIQTWSAVVGIVGFLMLLAYYVGVISTH